jgi:hypothetical protein
VDILEQKWFFLFFVYYNNIIKTLMGPVRA